MTAPAAAPPGPMRLALRQVRYENRSFWRNPASAFFTAAFPLMFLFIFEVAFGGEDIQAGNRTVDISTFFVPAIAALAIVTTCFTNVAMSVTFDRDQGLLKRLRGTPLPNWAFLFGRIAHATLLGLALVTVVTAVGALALGVEVPTNTMAAFLVTVAVGAASFCALGLAMTAAVPNADAAPAIINAVVLPLYFFSDVFIHIEDPPAWIDILGNVFPVKHLSLALQTAFDPFETGAGFEPFHLAVIAAWGVAGALLAARFFSWEPRR